MEEATKINILDITNRTQQLYENCTLRLGGNSYIILTSHRGKSSFWWLMNIMDPHSCFNLTNPEINSIAADLGGNADGTCYPDFPTLEDLHLYIQCLTYYYKDKNGLI